MNTISIILPCFNEEENMDEIYSRLTSILSKECHNYELIFIDDGSADNTLGKLKALCELDRKVKVLELSRNFGHQAAICAGLDYAQGDAVIMMDADLQHPPELIPTLIEKWKSGYEIVYTIRTDPPGLPQIKKITAKLFYKLINKLANINIPENGADFRLLDRKVVLQLSKMAEKTKFLRGLVNWIGYKQCPVHYTAFPRYAGETKYTLFKMLKFAFDGITSFSAFPLHISTGIGFIVSVLSFIYAVYAIYIRIFTNVTLPGWTSVLVAILFLGGVQLLSLGMIGEYINRIYTETKSRPVYIVRSIHGSHTGR